MKQKKEDLQSAFILYCNDSTLISSIEPTGEYLLYQDDPFSLISYQEYPWGLYECVNISISDNKFYTTKLVGKDRECYHEAAFWLSSREVALSLTGQTNISGKVYAPLLGINYAELDGKSFQGKQLVEDSIHLSHKELPPVDASSLQLIRLHQKAASSETDHKPYYSFREPTSYLFLSEQPEDLHFRGNVVLFGDDVLVTATSVLNDVILVARKVTIEEDFIGSLQILATDTVIIKDRAQLLYPSGVFLEGNNQKTYLQLNAHSQLHGYALVFGSTENNSGLTIATNYHQDSTANLEGLAYVDGIADIRGTCSGAVYIKECFYLPDNGLYAGTINGATISRNNQIAYPNVFLQSNYRKKEIKTVY